MKYLSMTEIADKWGISERGVKKSCHILIQKAVF